MRLPIPESIAGADLSPLAVGLAVGRGSQPVGECLLRFLRSGSCHCGTADRQRPARCSFGRSSSDDERASVRLEAKSESAHSLARCAGQVAFPCWLLRTSVQSHDVLFRNASVSPLFCSVYSSNMNIVSPSSVPHFEFFSLNFLCVRLCF